MSLGIIRVFAIILFVYLNWRKLRENYKEDEIVNYSWVALLGFLIGGRIVYGLVNFGIWNDNWWNWFSVWNKPGMDYIGGFLSLILVNFIFCRINSWKFIPFCEDTLINFFWLVVTLMIDELVRSKFDLRVGIYLLFLLVLSFFVIWIKGKYRSLVWYKSGKKGFAFLATGFLAFLGLGFLGVYFKVDLRYSILYWLISLISLVELFILGEVFNILAISKRK